MLWFVTGIPVGLLSDFLRLPLAGVFGEGGVGGGTFVGCVKFVAVLPVVSECLRLPLGDFGGGVGRGAAGCGLSNLLGLRGRRGVWDWWVSLSLLPPRCPHELLQWLLVFTIISLRRRPPRG